MIKKIYHKLFQSNLQRIGGAALLLGGASLASRLLGVLRDRILAGTFGAGNELDIYYAAFRFPDLVFNLIILGALSAGFIPVFVRFLRREDKREAWDLANCVVNFVGLFLIFFSLTLFVFAPFLIKVLTPGFSAEKIALTVKLTRIMAWSPFFLGLSAVLGNILQSLKRFFTYALAPVLYNLGIIFGVLVLAPRFGLAGLGFGVVLGALLHLLVQIPSLAGTGYWYRLKLNWRQPGLKDILYLTSPRILSVALLQLNFLAITVLASSLAAGSIAIFDLAYNIWSFPLGIFAASFVVASFPRLSEEAGRQDWKAFKQSFVYTFRQILFYLIPASALFIILRAQIVRVVLGTGKFTWSNTILTVESLKFLTLGLLAEGLILFISRAFFALEDSKTPFFLGLFGSIARISLAWFFGRYLGVSGLALGFAGGAILQMLALWLSLERKLKDFRDRSIFIGGVKMSLAALGAGIVAWLGLRLGATLVDMQTGLGIFLQGMLAGLLGVFVYVLISSWMKLEEMRDLLQALFSKFSLKKVVVEEDIANL